MQRKLIVMAVASACNYIGAEYRYTKQQEFIKEMARIKAQTEEKANDAPAAAAE